MSFRWPNLVRQIGGGCALFLLAGILIALPLQPGRAVRFDVGGRWEGLYISGLHAIEDTGGTTYRWAGKDTRLELPAPSGPALLTIRLATAPLPAGQELGLTLEANAAPPVPLPPADGLATYRILVYPGGQPSLAVQLRAQSALQTADDPREKSAAIDLVQVMPLRSQYSLLPAPLLLLTIAAAVVLMYAGLLRAGVRQGVALACGSALPAAAAVLLWREPALGLLLLQWGAGPALLVALGSLLYLVYPPLVILALYLAVLPYERIVTAPKLLAVTLPVGLLLAGGAWLPTLARRYWPAWVILGGALWAVLRFHLPPEVVAFPAALVVVAIAVKERLRDHRGNAVLVLGLALLAALPALHAALLSTSDSRTHLVYLNGLDVSVRAGILYPRWISHMGYGYGSAALNFYAPLSRYLAEAAHLVLRLDLLNALNLVYILGLPLAGLGMYRLMRDLYGRPEPALLAAAAYMIAPYALANIFVRGALAEALILGLLPWVLWAWGRLVERPGLPRALAAGGLLAAALLAHNALALFFLPILAGYLALRVARSQGPRGLARPVTWGWPALAGALALGLGAFYWLPALLQIPLVIAGDMAGGPWDPMRFYPPERLYPPWHNFFPLTLADSYSPDLFWRPNLAQVGLAAAGLVVGWRQRSFRLPGLFWSGIVLLTLFFQTGAARPLWDAIRGPDTLQFPWRLLGFTSLATAPLTGALALPPGRTGAGRPARAGLGIVALLAVFLLPLSGWVGWRTDTTGALSVEQLGQAMPEDHIAQFLPAWTMPLDRLHEGPSGVVRREGAGAAAELRHEEKGPAALEVQLWLPQTTTLRFNQTYFPGWRAEVDGVPSAVERDPELGLLALPVPAGERTVQLWFADTPVQTAGWALTAVSVAGVGGSMLWLAIKRRTRSGPGTTPAPSGQNPHTGL